MRKTDFLFQDIQVSNVAGCPVDAQQMFFGYIRISMDIQRYINDVDLLTLQLSAEYTPYAGSALETYSLSSSQISTAVTVAAACRIIYRWATNGVVLLPAVIVC